MNMFTKLFYKSSLVVLSLAITCLSFGQKPFSEPIEGQVEASFGGRIVNCKLSSLTIKYRLSTVSGEPAIYTNLKWKNDFGTTTDCLDESDFEIFIHVTVQYTDYWIPAQGTFGVMPKGDNRWGMNPLSGSPAWGKVFLKNEPSQAFQIYGKNFLSEDYAKAAWKSGYLRVAGILLIEKNGIKHDY